MPNTLLKNFLANNFFPIPSTLTFIKIGYGIGFGQYLKLKSSVLSWLMMHEQIVNKQSSLHLKRTTFSFCRHF